MLTKNYKIKLILIILFLLIYFLIIFFSNKNIKNQNLVCFKNNICIQVEIAKDSKQKKQGLMFRKKLDKNHGMLFIFEKADIYSFWMKNMHIPLDIIWLDKNYKIIYIKENAKPCNEQNCQSYKPDLPAKYIIEINSNFTKKNNIKIGDRIKIPRYHIDNEE